MTITERTLRNWRKQALKANSLDPLMYEGSSIENCQGLARGYKEQSERILRLTQELLDLALLKRSKS